MALDTLEKKKDEEALDERDALDALPLDDGKDHLRADVMGSIVKNDPSSPAYLGKMDNYITAHGAIDRFAPGTRGYDLSVGATAQPTLPARRMTSAAAPEISGLPTVPAAPVSSAPPALGGSLMQPARPQHRGWLGKIGQVAKTMGNVAGDIFAPEAMAMIPGTDLNKRIEAARAEALRERQEKLALERETVEQKPEMAEAAGEERGKLEAQKEAEQEKRQQEAIAAQEKRETERETAAEKTQEARFAEQEKLESEREAAAEQRLREAAPTKQSARADKSFEYNNTALDKVAQPLDALNLRMGRLNDTINQNTPQADALVAPELLSVMSGGQGSGLRMNEAEIARIVGGRSNWEALQAAVNKWKTDPKAALSITTAQRAQIRALAKTVQDKLIAKEKIIDDARNALIDTDDPKEHRRIVADTKKKLDAIDAGMEAEPERPANVPKDYVYDANGPKGAGWYKPKAKNAKR
jgi:hypothetical protein